MLDKQLLMQQALYDPYLLLALKRPLTQQFFETLKEYAENKRNMVLSIYGKTGSGKSTAAFYVAEKWARYVRVSFSAKHIAFTSQEALELLAKAKAKDIYVIDEQIAIFGTGSEREQAALSNIEATVRASQISLIYCSPEPTLHVNHYLLRTTGQINKATGSNVSILYDGMEKKPMGYTTTGMPPLAKDFWAQYEKRKHAFIRSVLEQKPTDKTKEYEKLAEEFITMIKKKKMNFLSKKALKIKLMQVYKRNYTIDEWDFIATIIEEACRELDMQIYASKKKLWQ